MAVTSRVNLKKYFQTGDRPTQDEFIDLIDSFVHIDEGDDPFIQISNTLRISGSETYQSGSTTLGLGLVVTGSILPGANNTFDLGSPDKVWKELFLGENSLRFVDTTTGNESARIGVNTAGNINIASKNLRESIQFGSSNISGDEVGFIAVNGKAGAISTVLRAEIPAFASSNDFAMSHIAAKGSGSFGILLDATSPGIQERAKFVVESNTSLPGVGGKRLLSVSESGEVKAPGYLVANGLATPTTIGSNTIIPEDHIMTLHTTKYKPTITVNSGIDFTVGKGAELTIKSIF